MLQAYYNYDVSKKCVDRLWLVSERDRTGYLCSGQHRGLIFTSATNQAHVYFTSENNQYLNGKGFWLYYEGKNYYMCKQTFFVRGLNSCVFIVAVKYSVPTTSNSTSKVIPMSTRATTTNPGKTARETTTRHLKTARETTTRPLKTARETTTRPLKTARETTTRPLKTARETTTRPLRIARETTTRPLRIARDTTVSTNTITKTTTENAFVILSKRTPEHDKLIKRRLRMYGNSPKSKDHNAPEREHSQKVILIKGLKDSSRSMTNHTVTTPQSDTSTISVLHKVMPFMRQERAETEIYKDVMWGKVREYHETPKIIMNNQNWTDNIERVQVLTSENKISAHTLTNIKTSIHTPRAPNNVLANTTIGESVIPMTTTKDDRPQIQNKTIRTIERTNHKIDVNTTTSLPKTSTYRSQWATENFHVEEKYFMRKQSEARPRDFMTYDKTVMTENDYWENSGNFKLLTIISFTYLVVKCVFTIL